MGAIPSKLGEQGDGPTRKPLRPRSSLNLLKRSRTTSSSTRASYPVVPATVTVDVDNIGYIKQTTQLDELSSPASSQQSPPDSSLLSSTIKERDDDDVGSISSTGSTATATRMTTPTNSGKHATATPMSAPAREECRSTTPSPSATPKIMLKLPSMLPEDSPTKYGLRTASTPSPDKAALLRAQRKDMTPAGLFAHSVIQLKACHDQSTESTMKQSSFSQSSPCLLFTGPQHEHAKSVPNTTSGTTPARPVTNHGTQDMLSGRPPHRYYHASHAFPIKPSQHHCFRNHDGWHAAAKPRYNVLNPVACAVCDEYGAPVEGQEAAGDDFRRCNWCWLIVCGKCHDAFCGGGVEAMMERDVAGTGESERRQMAVVVV